MTHLEALDCLTEFIKQEKIKNGMPEKLADSYASAFRNQLETMIELKIKSKSQI